MKVTQIYSLMNTITHEMLGEEVVVNEDLSNVVELGNSFESVVGLDNYVKSLNDHIGRMIFVDRVYQGRVPSMLMDGWEFGSILEKVSPELPTATESETWELENGTSYDPNVFYKPSVTVKCWNNRVTFEIPVSITERQVKSAFSSATQLNAFISMIYTAVSNSMTVKLDGLIMRTLNNFIGETIHSEYTSDSGFDAKSGIRAVNLFYLYKQLHADTTLTATTCINDMDFIKFASYQMANYLDRIKVMSKLFNIGGMERFTPEDRLHIVMLSSFKNAANVYLQSDTFHEQYTALPAAESVVFWQGSGKDYSFSNCSAVNVKTSGNHTVSATGIIGVMFDEYACGVTNQNPRVTSQYNPKAEFYNEWHKFDAGYFNDQNENFVVFFVA